MSFTPATLVWLLRRIAPAASNRIFIWLETIWCTHKEMAAWKRRRTWPLARFFLPICSKANTAPWPNWPESRISRQPRKRPILDWTVWAAVKCWPTASRPPLLATITPFLPPGCVSLDIALALKEPLAGATAWRIGGTSIKTRAHLWQEYTQDVWKSRGEQDAWSSVRRPSNFNFELLYIIKQSARFQSSCL